MVSLTGGISQDVLAPSLDAVAPLAGLGGMIAPLAGLAGPLLGSLGHSLFGGGNRQQQAQQQQQQQSQQLGPFIDSFNPSASASSTSSSVLNNLQLPNPSAIPGLPAFAFQTLPGVQAPHMQQPIPIQQTSPFGGLPALPASAAGLMPVQTGGGGGALAGAPQMMPGQASPIQGYSQDNVPVQPGYSGSPTAGMLPRGMTLPAVPMQAAPGGVQAAQATGAPVVAQGPLAAEQPRYDTTGGGAPLQGGGNEDVLPDVPIPAEIQASIDGLRQMESQGNTVATTARNNLLSSVKSIQDQHKLQRQPLQAKLDKLNDLTHELGTPDGYLKHRDETAKAIYNQLTPGQQAALERNSEREQGGLGDNQPSAGTSALTKAGHLLEGAARYGLLGRSVQRGEMARERLQMTRAVRGMVQDYRQAKLDEHISDKYQQAINEAMGHMMTKIGAEVTATEAQLSHLDTMASADMTRAASDVFRLAGIDMSALGAKRAATTEQGQLYAAGERAAEARTAAADKTRHEGLTERQGAANLAAHQQSVKQTGEFYKWQEMGQPTGKAGPKPTAPKPIVNTAEWKEFRDLGIPEPAAGQSFEAFRKGLIPLIQRNDVSRDDANRALRALKAKGMK